VIGQFLLFLCWREIEKIMIMILVLPVVRSYVFRVPCGRATTWLLSYNMIIVLWSIGFVLFLNWIDIFQRFRIFLKGVRQI